MPTADYRLKDGTRVSGTTTIISGNLGWNTRALMHWSWLQGRDGKDYKQTSKDACDSGTIAHAMIECDLKGTEYKGPEYAPEIISKAETAFLAWLEWKSLVEFKLIESEKAFVSEKYGYGGTIDIAAIKKKTAIVDLKTSNSTYADHLIQIASYGNLWNEAYPDNPIEAYYLLRLGKEDGSFHYSYWPELTEAFEAFKHLLALHKLQKTLKGKV